MQTKKTVAARLAAASLFTLLVAGAAFAQPIQVDVPYQFTFASKVLPAGKYTFRLADRLVRVQPTTGEELRETIITRLGGRSDLMRDGALVFDKAGGTRILSEVWLPETDGVLLHSTPNDHTHEIVLFSEGEGNGRLSGKAIYGRTCGRCHGPDGNGEAAADKFFKTRIPRLNSAEVQGRSDAQLRTIIAQGSREMAPVEIDESGFRHRLHPESVDAVIAHVRTLRR